MIAIQDSTPFQQVNDLAAAIRAQVELDQKAQELHAQELRIHEQEIAAMQEKNHIAAMQVSAMNGLAAIVGDLNVKVSELHAAVMNYTQGYIIDHHLPLTDQLKALHARVEVILQFLSAIAPSVMQKDERIPALQSQLLEFLRHPMTGGSVVVNTGDSNVKLQAEGDMSRMTITGR